MKFLSRKAVCELVALSRTQLSRIPDFPEPIKIGEHVNSRVVYVESEVVDWLRRRIAKRDEAHASS